MRKGDDTDIAGGFHPLTGREWRRGIMADHVLTPADETALDELDVRLRTLLPAQYQESYQDLRPVAMPSAGLKFGADGKVAWDEIWQSFCDLAMAGGPPHKGALLEPGSADAIADEPVRYQEVVDEICRGITMASKLPATASPMPGWVRVNCLSETMADWLLRAIVMENVSVVRTGPLDIHLPAAPHFRLEQEIKNVVTVIAKTTHYWMGHLARVHKADIGGLLAMMAIDAQLLEPEMSQGPGAETARNAAAAAIGRLTGLQVVAHRYRGWLGLEMESVGAAVWMMRALVASNVLARRESTALFVPVNADVDPSGEQVARRVAHAHRLALLVRRP